MLQPVALGRELEWIVARILRNVALIERHLDAAEKVRAAILRADTALALQLLKDAPQSVGYTLANTSLQIALTQVVSGLEAQKDLAASIRRDGASPILQFLSFHWSVRAEDNMSPISFAADVRRRLDSASAGGTLRASLEFQLLSQVPTIGNENELLASCNSDTVIDAYEVLVTLATAVIAQARPSSLQFISAIRRLSENINDARLLRLLVLGPGSVRSPFASIDYRSAALSRDGSMPIHTPDGLEEVFAAANLRGATVGKDVEVLGRIEVALSGLRGIDNTAVIASQSLAKLGLMFSHSPIGQWMTAVASAYAPRQVPFSAFNDGQRFVNDTSVLEALSVLDADGRTKYASQIADHFGSISPIAEAAKIVSDVAYTPTNILTEKAAAYLGLWGAVLAKSKSEILARSEAAAGQGQREGVYHYVLALLQQGHTEDALRYAVSLLFKEPSYATVLPLDNLIGAVYPDDTNLFPHLIETPLLFWFYSEHVSAAHLSYLSYTAEDYVAAMGVRRPSELVDAATVGPPAYIGLFLSEVCRQQTMRLFTVFATARELEDERIAICQLLARRDESVRDAFENEARSIVTSRLVQEALKQLQASKMSIDQEGILSWARRRLGEDFVRYKALAAGGLAVVDEAYREALFDALKSGEFPASLYDVPENEASALFNSLVKRLVDRCAFDPEHGLDCYLSLRIRHGTMSGLLRSAAEHEKVVTRRTSDTGTYRTNTYWAAALSESVAPDTWSLFEDRLAAFSMSFDELIAEFTNKYIQVLRDEKPDALFDVRLNPISIFAIATEVNQDTTFEVFAHKCIDLFWGRVGNSLQDLKRFVRTKMRDQFVKLFERLEQDTRTEIGLAPLSDAIIRARVGTEAALDRVSGWFELPAPSTVLKLTLNELVAVGLEVTQRFHHDFKPTVQMPLTDIPPLTGALQLFSDIFFVIFENVYTHCGSTTPNITISADLQNNRLSVLVENSVEDASCNEALKQRVDRAREKIVSGAYLNDMTREGGTGLPKLAKLVNYKNDARFLDFALDIDRKRFWIEFSLPTHLLETPHREEDDAAALG
ncbi:MAG: hypothetical protein EON58_02045 [Alphaproteobacteria bacterium]|nr:MAG: hypothetical protein EON58_02045 [Alphaproteobacteria bacterium]